MSRSEDLVALGNRLLLSNYGRAPVVMSRGSGCQLWDVEGRRYLDMTAGVAVCVLGHGDPGLAQALFNQASTLHHTSNLYFIEMQIKLAEALARRGFPGRLFFCNSGTEANEAALKLARRYQIVTRGQPDRTEIIAFDGSFHGRTMGALSVTGQPRHRQGFGPLVPGVRFLPFGDVEAARAAITDQTCAVITEPIQAEGGINLPPARLPAGAAAAVQRAGRGPHLRRGPDRRRPHRHLLRLREGGRRARHRHAGQGPGGRRPHGRHDGQRGGGARLRAGHPRLDLRRQPAGLRRRPVRAERHRRAAPAGQLPDRGRPPRLGPAAAV